MDLIFHIVTQQSLLKSYLNNKITIRTFFIVLTVLTFSWNVAGLCASFSDIKKAFDQDFERIDPETIKDHYKSIVENLTGMKITGSIPIKFEPRGDVKNKWLQMELKDNKLDNEDRLLAYEFLLKRFRLLKQEKSLKEILLSSYDDVFGLYDPSKKNILFFNGTNRDLIPTILFHELMHAAQDETIDIEKYQKKNCVTLDSALAASALLEGQASALEFLVQVEKNLEDKSRKEAIEEAIAYLDDRGDILFQNSNTNGLGAIRSFPYLAGVSFVLKRMADGVTFKEMFENVPATSEQVIHINKFKSNELPGEIMLGKKIDQITSLNNCKLLLDTTLGEYYISQIFNNAIDDKIEVIKESSAGWNGDRIVAVKKDKSLFFIWDTLWDTAKDADEFYREYSVFSKSRFKKSEISDDKKSRLLTCEDNSVVFQLKSKNRVLIIEGQIIPDILENLRKILDI